MARKPYAHIRMHGRDALRLLFFIETFTIPSRRTVSCAATATHPHYNPSRHHVSRPPTPRCRRQSPPGRHMHTRRCGGTGRPPRRPSRSAPARGPSVAKGGQLVDRQVRAARVSSDGYKRQPRGRPPVRFTAQTSLPSNSILTPAGGAEGQALGRSTMGRGKPGKRRRRG